MQNNKMMTVVLLVAAAMVAASCGKENNTEPQPAEQEQPQQEQPQQPDTPVDPTPQPEEPSLAWYELVSLDTLEAWPESEWWVCGLPTPRNCYMVVNVQRTDSLYRIYSNYPHGMGLFSWINGLAMRYRMVDDTITVSPMEGTAYTNWMLLDTICPTHDTVQLSTFGGPANSQHYWGFFKVTGE